MSTSMQHTETADLSETTQPAEGPTESERRVAAYECGFHDAAERIISTLRDCPAWCNDHHFPIDGFNDWADPDDDFHRRSVYVPEGRIEIVEGEEGFGQGGRPILMQPAIEWMHLPEARAYAKAILRLCDDFEARGGLGDPA